MTQTSGRRLTRWKLRAIRNSPCGQCKAIPILENGERCHPHRIIHGADGGKYTVDNVVPRCPSCHDIEHGGNGEAPFIGAARMGGCLGGKYLKALYPNLARDTMRHTNKKYPGLARKASHISRAVRTPEQRRKYARMGWLAGGQKAVQASLATRTLEQRYEYARMGGLAAAKNSTAEQRRARACIASRYGVHSRWHTTRGVYNANCSLCREEEAQDE